MQPDIGLVAERALDPADFPGAPEENLVPGSMLFQKTAGPVELTDYQQLVGLGSRHELAPSIRAWFHARRTAETPGCACCL